MGLNLSESSFPTPHPPSNGLPTHYPSPLTSTARRNSRRTFPAGSKHTLRLHSPTTQAAAQCAPMHTRPHDAAPVCAEVEHLTLRCARLLRAPPEHGQVGGYRRALRRMAANYVVGAAAHALVHPAGRVQAHANHHLLVSQRGERGLWQLGMVRWGWDRGWERRQQARRRGHSTRVSVV